MSTILDAVQLLLLLEGAVLTRIYVRTGRGLRPYSLWCTLAAGGFILLAMRLALAGAGLGVVGLTLMAAGIAHGADVALRWKRHTHAALADRHTKSGRGGSLG